MRALFVDHAYHGSTKSSRFIIDVLSKDFQLDTIMIDPDINECDQLNDKKYLNYDFVVLWQIDYLAAYFLRNGIKTIIMPMFDGSSTLNNIHWQVAKDALFINFSLNLHILITNAGCDSIYVKYFPPRKCISAEALYNTVSDAKPTAFFWERRPDTLLNTDEICRMLSGAISHLHIHQAPDPGLISRAIPLGLNFSVSTSKWFEHPDDYLNCVCSHDIYVAPRYSEGIGMGFLEAMGLGKVVLAHDAPTHSEYIKSNHNGILFDAFGRDYLSASEHDFMVISANAKHDADDMRDAWVNHYVPMLLKRIKSYVENDTCIGDYLSQSFSDRELLDRLLLTHCDLNNYYSVLERLFKVYKPSSTEDGIIQKFNELETHGKYAEAISMLEHKIAECNIYSVYNLILTLAKNRFKLKKFHC
jgi:hypothetical protein